MTNIDLASSYMRKATARLGILGHLFDQADYSDVVREAQEIVELATKAMLRRAGIDPPKWHDVGGIILENSGRFPGVSTDNLKRIAEISVSLARDRELAFYGDIDFIPTEEYSKESAEKAIAEAKFVVGMASLYMQSR